MTILFNLQPTSSQLHPLQVENCDSNSRLVVNEDDNGKFRLERVELRNYPGTFRVSIPHIFHKSDPLFKFWIRPLTTVNLCLYRSIKHISNRSQNKKVVLTFSFIWRDCQFLPQKGEEVV